MTVHAPTRPRIATPERPGDQRHVRTGARAGLGDIVPVIIGLAPFALALGVAVDESSVPDAAGWFASLLVYAGSSQFTALAVVDAGGSAIAAVLAGLVINARLLVYGAALAPRFVAQPTWFRWLGPATIVDQTFALIDRRPERNPEWFRGYWLSAGAVLGAAYLALIGVGVLAGPVIPSRLSLDFAFPIMFIAMLVPKLTENAGRAAALAAAVTTASTLGLPHGLGLLLGGLVGALAGVLTARRSS